MVMKLTFPWHGRIQIFSLTKVSDNMKILIIEDEPLVARDLQNLLQRIEPSAQVECVLSSVETSKKWFSQHALPDLILSDIQLSDGISFDIFENLHLNCPIIFTTAYDDYAIRAFK